MHRSETDPDSFDAHHRLNLILTVAAGQAVHSAIYGYLENSRPKAANVHSLEALQGGNLEINSLACGSLQPPKEFQSG